MARSNYSYAKRLKEIARQKKQEEKRLRKQAKSGPAPDEGLRPAGGEQEGGAPEAAGTEAESERGEEKAPAGPEAQ